MPLLQDSARTIALSPAPAGSWTRLQFSMRRQRNTNWCWAAVGAGIADYYDPQTTWTQCRIVEHVLGVSTCCHNGKTPECNRRQDIVFTLGEVQHYEDDVAGALIAEDIRKAIAQDGRPIVARIDWAGLGGHYVVVKAFRLVGAELWLKVDDPAQGTQTVTLDDLAGGNYGGPGVGRWTLTHLTKP